MGEKLQICTPDGDYSLMKRSTSKAQKLDFPCTNNMAEYEACILGLKLTFDMGVHELLVIGDADLLIHQVRGEWAVKNSKITPYIELV